MHAFRSATLSLLLVAGCSSGQANADACTTAAIDYQGVVAAGFASTISSIEAVPAVANNPQLAAYPAGQPASLCYIDAEFGKGPPPGLSGSIAPSFDRGLIVVVGSSVIPVTFGYRSNLPIASP